MNRNKSFETVWTLRDLFQSFIQSPFGVEYTILFVLMGIVMYFAGNKFWKAAVLLVVSALCYSGGNLGAHNPSMFTIRCTVM